MAKPLPPQLPRDALPARPAAAARCLAAPGTGPGRYPGDCRRQLCPGAFANQGSARSCSCRGSVCSRELRARPGPHARPWGSVRGAAGGAVGRGLPCLPPAASGRIAASQPPARPVVRAPAPCPSSASLVKHRPRQEPRPRIPHARGAGLGFAAPGAARSRPPWALGLRGGNAAGSGSGRTGPRAPLQLAEGEDGPAKRLGLAALGLEGTARAGLSRRDCCSGAGSCFALKTKSAAKSHGDDPRHCSRPRRGSGWRSTFFVRRDAAVPARPLIRWERGRSAAADQFAGSCTDRDLTALSGFI